MSHNSDVDYKLVIVGDVGTGKSSLMMRFTVCSTHQTFRARETRHEMALNKQSQLSKQPRDIAMRKQRVGFAHHFLIDWRIPYD